MALKEGEGEFKEMCMCVRACTHMCIHTDTHSMEGQGDGILRQGQRLGQWCRCPSSDDKKAGTCSLGRGRSRA